MTQLFIKEKNFNEMHRVIVIEQILDALHYLHSNDIVHRDLKIENVVYASDSKDSDFSRISLKLIDFGFAALSKLNQKQLRDFIGTPYYMAPEIVSNSYYGSEVDIWSLGVLTFYLIEGAFPFLGKARPQLFEVIKRGRVNFFSRNWE
jgi:serine/threonine protein kinase